MPNRRLNVFLCHAKEDKPTVRELYRQLTAEGWLDVWLDAEKLLPGQEWDIEIEKAVEHADVVVVCLSTHSVDKEGYVQKELRFVLNIADEKPEGTIFVVPLRLDDCQVPRRIRAWQYVDYFPKNNRKWAYQRLLESLKLRARKLGISMEQPAPHVGQIFNLSANAEKPTPPVVKRDNISLYAPETRSTETEGIKPAAPAKEPPHKEKRTGFKFDARFWPILVGLFALTLCGFAVNYLVKNWPAAPAPTQTSEVSETSEVSTASPTFTTAPPTKPPTETPTIRSPTETPTITFTPAPGVGRTWISPKDGMVMMFVPAGKFTMGSDSGEGDEQPVHEVELADFWIDQTEVTNAMYAKCMQAGGCTPPSSASSDTRQGYYGNSEFDDFPVIYVSWNDAKNYCDWRGDGTRLPTEAEWEKAARGTDGRTYPWGHESPNGNLLNYNQNVGDTTEVGKYPAGASIYGALDMAGNVWEWVADWYDASYYANSPSSNPQGPSSGDWRVLRGGAWYNDINDARSAGRVWGFPSNANYLIGFRCARSP